MFWGLYIHCLIQFSSMIWCWLQRYYAIIAWKELITSWDNLQARSLSHISHLILWLLVLSADKFCKQFGTRSGPANVGPDLDPNCLTLMVFLTKFFKNADFEKNHQTTKSMKNYSGGKELSSTYLRKYMWVIPLKYFHISPIQNSRRSCLINLGSSLCWCIIFWSESFKAAGQPKLCQFKAIYSWFWNNTISLSIYLIKRGQADQDCSPELCLQFQIHVYMRIGHTHWLQCFSTNQIHLSFFLEGHPMTISMNSFWILTTWSRRILISHSPWWPCFLHIKFILDVFIKSHLGTILVM